MANALKLAAVRIFVSDIVGASAFYRDQIGLVSAAGGPEDGYVVFPLANGVDLILEEDVPEDEDGDSLVGRFIGISLAVPDLDAAYHALCDRGVRFLDAPEIQPWGGGLAHFLDPDDNVLSLVEALKPDV
ncbi:MAG: VOC family protein [Alphaproteobacteria bacterium]